MMVMMMMIHGLRCSSIAHLMVVVYNNYSDGGGGV
jgi:hypothetical protein